jgi:Rod binding domain-containing protein
MQLPPTPGTPDAAPLSPKAGPSATEMARLRQAAEDFTAVALTEMLQPMFDTAETADGFFGGGEAERAFKPMMISEIAKQIAHEGGLGLAEPVLQQMLRLQEAGR